MTIRSHEAADINPAAIDEFDALLDTSSLGAPHVTAVSASLPQEVRTRIQQSTGSPAPAPTAAGFAASVVSPRNTDTPSAPEDDVVAALTWTTSTAVSAEPGSFGGRRQAGSTAWAPPRVLAVSDTIGSGKSVLMELLQVLLCGARPLVVTVPTGSGRGGLPVNLLRAQRRRGEHLVISSTSSGKSGAFASPLWARLHSQEPLERALLARDDALVPVLPGVQAPIAVAVLREQLEGEVRALETPWAALPIADLLREVLVGRLVAIASACDQEESHGAGNMASCLRWIAGMDRPTVAAEGNWLLRDAFLLSWLSASLRDTPGVIESAWRDDLPQRFTASRVSKLPVPLREEDQRFKVSAVLSTWLEEVGGPADAAGRRLRALTPSQGQATSSNFVRALTGPCRYEQQAEDMRAGRKMKDLDSLHARRELLEDLLGQSLSRCATTGIARAGTPMWWFTTDHLHRRLQHCTVPGKVFWEGAQWLDDFGPFLRAAPPHLLSLGGEKVGAQLLLGKRSSCPIEANTADSPAGETSCWPDASARPELRRTKGREGGIEGWPDSSNQLLAHQASKTAYLSSGDPAMPVGLICHRDIVADAIVLWADVEMRLPREGENPDASYVVPARITYRSADPYAVEMLFRPRSQDEVPWTVARDLLVEGLHQPAGTGDVRVWSTNSGTPLPAKEWYFISLFSPEGEAVLAIDPAQLKAFLEETGQLVAYGAEHLHTQAALSELEADILQHRI